MSQKLLAMIGVSAALLAAPSAASAADLMPLKAPMPAPVMSWTGCYVDGGWGYGMWNQDHNTTTPVGTTVTTTDGGRGWMGKVGGGCDYQTPLFNNRVVIGVFADWDPMSLKGSNSPSLLFGAPAQPITANEKETSAWFCRRARRLSRHARVHDLFRRRLYQDAIHSDERIHDPDGYANSLCVPELQ